MRPEGSLIEVSAEWQWLFESLVQIWFRCEKSNHGGLNDDKMGVNCVCKTAVDDRFDFNWKCYICIYLYL